MKDLQAFWCYRRTCDLQAQDYDHMPCPGQKLPRTILATLLSSKGYAMATRF